MVRNDKGWRATTDTEADELRQELEGLSVDDLERHFSGCRRKWDEKIFAVYKREYARRGKMMLVL